MKEGVSFHGWNELKFRSYQIFIPQLAGQEYPFENVIKLLFMHLCVHMSMDMDTPQFCIQNVWGQHSESVPSFHYMGLYKNLKQEESIDCEENNSKNEDSYLAPKLSFLPSLTHSQGRC